MINRGTLEGRGKEQVQGREATEIRSRSTNPKPAISHQLQLFSMIGKAPTQKIHKNKVAEGLNSRLVRG